MNYFQKYRNHEKTCFQRGFGFKNISFIKKNVDGASKTKTSQEDLTSIWLSSSYHLEWKIFIEVSFSNNIHTREFFFFAVATLVTLSNRLKNL